MAPSSDPPMLVREITVPEKDCRTCVHYGLLDGRDPKCFADFGESGTTCVLGSRYEWASFTPLWRSE